MFWLNTSILLLLIPGPVFSQTLLLDRGVSPGGDSGTTRIEASLDDGSLMGDDFTIGRDGETWIIDRIRTWVTPNPVSATDLGTVFQGITFLGGLANDQAAVECACHNLLALKTGALSEKGSANPDIVIAPGSMPDQWQVDFQNFRWSVPGGAKIQFAIRAVPRRNSQRNSTARLLLTAVPVPGEHSLRIFAPDGGFKSFLDKKAQDSTESLAIAIQVWAHPAR